MRLTSLLVALVAAVEVDNEALDEEHANMEAALDGDSEEGALSDEELAELGISREDLESMLHQDVSGEIMDGLSSDKEGEDEDGSSLVAMTKADFLRVLQENVDTNKDMRASLDELRAHAQRVSAADAEAAADLESWDEDKDGKLTEAELKVRMDESLQDMEETMREAEQDKNHRKFLAADKDGDGKLTKDELKLFLTPELDEAVLNVDATEDIKAHDKDGDGKLSKEEWEAGFEWFGALDPATGDENAPETPESRKQRMDEGFTDLDKNKDGYLDVHEFGEVSSGRHHMKSTLKHLIHLVDQNKDGHVSLEEAEQHFEKVKDHEAVFLWLHDDL
mmetsp:Transcript_402/g.876  ORF Transcript_402/g.876 Transcript_402/m.876 type:complete len:335 (-) Transcript_402:31-1035(-)